MTAPLTSFTPDIHTCTFKSIVVKLFEYITTPHERHPQSLICFSWYYYCMLNEFHSSCRNNCHINGIHSKVKAGYTSGIMGLRSVILCLRCASVTLWELIFFLLVSWNFKSPTGKKYHPLWKSLI